CCRWAFGSRAGCWRRGASIRGDCRDGSPRGARRRDALHRDRVRLPARDPGRARPRAVRRPAGPDGEGAHAAPAVARTRRATRAGGRGRGTGDDARAQAKDARVVCGGPCERAPAARATEDTGATDVVAVGADTGRCSVTTTRVPAAHTSGRQDHSMLGIDRYMMAVPCRCTVHASAATTGTATGAAPAHTTTRTERR